MSYQLSRQLTSHKISYAHAKLSDTPNLEGGKYLVEIGRTEINDREAWYVHYIHVLNDGSREVDQDLIYGSYEYARSLFRCDLLLSL
jgi:hypothetical protein